jgi:magnesium-transporting ATPase (P-type)
VHRLTLYSDVASLCAAFSSSSITDLLPFDPYRKRSSCIRHSGSSSALFCRGSTESLLSVSTHIRDSAGRMVQLTDDARQEMHRVVEAMGEKDIRVLAFARRELSEDELDNVKGGPEEKKEDGA